MPTENPYETPQTLGAAPDNRGLHKRAGKFMALAAACCVLGVGLMCGSIYVIHGPSRRLAARHDTPSPSELANDVARTAPTAKLLWYIGVPLAAIGGVTAVPSGVLWFFTRNANNNRMKDLRQQ
jgi:hypothetical protein